MDVVCILKTDRQPKTGLSQLALQIRFDDSDGRHGARMQMYLQRHSHCLKKLPWHILRTDIASRTPCRYSNQIITWSSLEHTQQNTPKLTEMLQTLMQTWTELALSITLTWKKLNSLQGRCKDDGNKRWH